MSTILQSNLSYLRWLLMKARKRSRHWMARKLFRETDEDPGRTLVVAGTARSGTTWLADLIAAGVPSRLMFEPFHRGKLPQISSLPLFPYLRQGEIHPVLESFADEVVTGRIRHPWIDSQVACLRPSRRIVKDVRVNLLLHWLIDQYPQLPVAIVLRHPCAVVLSRMRAGWSAEDDLQDMLAQESLRHDFLNDRLPVIRAAQEPEERHALVWCVHYLVPLTLVAPGKARFLFYEDLCADPDGEVRRLSRGLGVEVGSNLARTARTPSVTSRPDSAVVGGRDPLSGWTRELEAIQIERILAVVAAFQLDRLYGSSTMPQLGNRDPASALRASS